MLATILRTLLTDFSLVMLAAALVLAAATAWFHRRTPHRTFANELLAWLLLLSLGVQGVYTFILHVFFPATSAANIGWAPSPFQYEVGIADLTVGVLGILAFRANFSFRLAAVLAGVVWYGGDAIGHIHQMIVADNFAPGNAGPWFWTDVAVPLLLIACIARTWQQHKGPRSSGERV